MNFLFEDTNEESELCGEIFFVQCNNLREAFDIIAKETNFEIENLICLGAFDDDDAEVLGYDTY